MKFFEAKDQSQIFYKDMGRGAPVILIHGWPLNADMWEYQTLALLRQGYRVISYDRRGFGRSEHAGEGYDYDTFASDLNDLINHLELQKVALVGFSMGGGEIARYLSKYGTERVSSVALVSAVTPFMLKTDSNPDGIPEKEFAGMIEGLEADRPKFLAAFSKMFFGITLVNHPVSAETLDWTAQMANMASLKGSIDCVTAFGHTDFRSDMAAFKVPTLIIHGTDDKTVPIKPSGEQAAAMIPGAVFRKYDGAPHGLFITHKDQLNSDLLEFLGGHALTADVGARTPAYNQTQLME